jgi:hypothetical protein
MTGEIHMYLNGALAALSAVIGLFFLRYWRLTRDRFFVFFTSAFWIMSVNWTLVASFATDETRHYFYVARLLAFVLILVAIIDKNRHSPS